MNLNTYTDKAREAVLEAQRLAGQYGQAQIEPEHLLLALLQQPDGIVPQIVAKLELQAAALGRDVEADIVRLPKVSGGNAQASIGQRLSQTLDSAEAQAKQMGDEYVSTEHQFIAIADGRGAAATLLKNNAVTRDRILEALTTIRGTQRVTSQQPEATYAALEKYGRDLTALVQRGKLDPVIGRDEEIRRTMEVLSRRTKNNPVLIG